jgi:3-deoxy-D-manno-octulosonate 8-phosphate phosphatase (KDO 8-P phosphatase)
MDPSFAANRSWTPELDRRARGISWMLLDVDGVLTDGSIHLAESGELVKTFHVRDGLAIKLARRAGLEVGILTARRSPIIELRARELGIEEVMLGREEKGPAFAELLERRGLGAASVAYMGDDLPDLPVLDACGLSAAPADAVAEVRASVDFVTEAGGGRGAVRELVERILGARGAWEPVLRHFHPAPGGHGGA